MQVCEAGWTLVQRCVVVCVVHVSGAFSDEVFFLFVLHFIHSFCDIFNVQHIIYTLKSIYHLGTNAQLLNIYSHQVFKFKHCSKNTTNTASQRLRGMPLNLVVEMICFILEMKEFLLQVYLWCHTNALLHDTDLEMGSGIITAPNTTSTQEHYRNKYRFILVLPKNELQAVHLDDITDYL